MPAAETLIKAIGDNPLPPVEQWDPDYCGKLDLVIKADGTWLYEGTPLTHYKIKLLFSRVIKKEQNDDLKDNYFLVTPVEKLGIQVEWMPFVIVDHQIIKTGGHCIYEFNDNLENKIQLTDKSQIKFSKYNQQLLPIIHIRQNLYASFSRQCYYRLIAEAELIHQHDKNHLTIRSSGQKFSLGEYKE